MKENPSNTNPTFSNTVLPKMIHLGYISLVFFVIFIGIYLLFSYGQAQALIRKLGYEEEYIILHCKTQGGEWVMKECGIFDNGCKDGYYCKK